MRYGVFLSYSHADRQIARRLAKQIETWRVPRRLVGQEAAFGPVPRRLGAVFRDRDELPASAELGERIQQALGDSAAMVVLCSPAAARSRWVNEEVRAFKSLGKTDRIFALIVDGDPTAGDGEAQCFPPALRFDVDGDGRVTDRPAEPVAADAREVGDGPRRARTRLFAGLLGVSYDALARREHHRRVQRVAAAAAAVLVAIVVALGLTLDAQRARTEAARTQAQSDSLIEYLVEQRHPELQGTLPPAATVTLDDGTRLGPLDSGNELDDTALDTQAAELIKQTIRWISLSKLDMALQAAGLAHARCIELVERHPGDQERIFDLGQAAFYVGFVYWKRRQMDRAERWLSAYRDTARVLAAKNPDRLEWVREKAYGDHNIAAWQAEMGHFQAAARMFEEEIATLNGLLARGFDPLQTAKDVAAGLSFQGEIAENLGNLSASTDNFSRSVATYEDVLKSEPDDPDLRNSLANQLIFLARLRTVTGDVPAALDAAGQAFQIQSELRRTDPGNTEWAYSEFVALRTKAEILAATGAVDESRAIFARILQATSVEALPPGNESAVGYALTMAARADALAGDPAQALARIDHALELAEQQAQEHPDSADEAATLALALVIRGQVLRQMGNQPEALASLTRALDVIRPQARDTRYWLVADPFVRAALLTGHEDEARSVMETLEATGYVPLWPWPAASPDPGNDSV